MTQIVAMLFVALAAGALAAWAIWDVLDTPGDSRAAPAARQLFRAWRLTVAGALAALAHVVGPGDAAAVVLCGAASGAFGFFAGIHWGRYVSASKREARRAREALAVSARDALAGEVRDLVERIKLDLPEALVAVDAPGDDGGRWYVDTRHGGRAVVVSHEPGGDYGVSLVRGDEAYGDETSDEYFTRPRDAARRVVGLLLAAAEPGPST